MTQNNLPQTRQPLSSPSAQDFGDQLLQLQRTAPSQIRTPGALAANLLADALLRYGQNRQRQPAPPVQLTPPPPIQTLPQTRLEAWLQNDQDPYQGQTLTAGGAPVGPANIQFGDGA